MTDKILRDYLGLKAPKIYSVTKRTAGVDPDLLYGIELEIEGLEVEPEDRKRRCVAGMQYHEDGSLRNNGGEFVTSPMNFANLEDTLAGFFYKNKFTDENYSERCSVHVHANCQDLTINQIRLVIAIYQVLERVLFGFIKNDRDNNIFCVPLSESILGTRIMTNPEEFMQKVAGGRWRKYTALNLIPLASQGTLEFRHMAGTRDYGYILQWCDIIGSLFKYARTNKFDNIIKDIQRLNTSSAYGTFMQSVFPGHLYDVLAVGNFREHLEEGVINMKCMLAPRPGGAVEKPAVTERAMVNGRIIDLEIEGENPWDAPAPAWGDRNQQMLDRANRDRFAVGRPAFASFQEQGNWLIGQMRGDRADPAVNEWLRRSEVRNRQRQAAIDLLAPRVAVAAAPRRGILRADPAQVQNFHWNPLNNDPAMQAVLQRAEIRAIPEPEDEGDF